jgi:beta-lactamase superfamily II metal-dependent hydrolase
VRFGKPNDAPLSVELKEQLVTKYMRTFGPFGHSLTASVRAAIFITAALTFLLPSVAVAQANGQLQIHFIPVGQGDAALIISPLGETMLIDSGPETASNCAGATGIVTYLASIGLPRLDYHVASHYDADHIGCADHVMARWPIQRVAYDRGAANAPTTQQYTQYANSVSARRAMVTIGQQIVLDAASNAPVVFHVAGVNGNGVSVSDENDRSVVLVLRFGWFDAEFGGDLPGANLSGHRDLESLIATNIGQVELHKVHHHGSGTSSNPGFMAAIQPKVAVLSVGSPNAYDHPTQTALDRIRSVGAITYWTTGGDGAPPQPGWDVLANGRVYVAVSPDATAFAVTADSATRQFAMWERPAQAAPTSQRDVAFDYGAAGLWLHSADTGWRQLNASNPDVMASGDVDGNGQSDLILDFPGQGVWIWLNDAEWLQLNTLNAGQIITADLDGNGKSAVLLDFP